MEEEKKINWLSLFIKIVIAFAFILIIVWLVSKIINKNELSDTFKNNINNMETVAVKYFKSIDLPTKKGESIKITLEEMIEKELIVSVSTGEGEKCSTKNSYSKITRNKDNYEVETRLECGKEKNTITRNFSLKDCQNCKTNNENETTKDNTTEEDNQSTTTNNTTSKTTYYEYVKETVTYTKWMKGNKTGDNIENKYEYYGIEEMTYYSLGAFSKKDIKNNTITYTLKLNKVPNNKYYFAEVKSTSYYDGEEEFNKDTNVSLTKDIKIDIKDISQYVLDEGNYTYKLTPYYYKGNFYIKVKLNIKSLDNVKTLNDKYLVPIKVTIKFSSNQLADTPPEGNYDTITYYRYKEINKEIKWSTEDYLEGYTKTGNTKVQ